MVVVLAKCKERLLIWLNVKGLSELFRYHTQTDIYGITVTGRIKIIILDISKLWEGTDQFQVFFAQNPNVGRITYVISIVMNISLIVRDIQLILGILAIHLAERRIYTSRLIFIIFCYRTNASYLLSSEL